MRKDSRLKSSFSVRWWEDAEREDTTKKSRGVEIPCTLPKIMIRIILIYPHLPFNNQKREKPDEVIKYRDNFPSSKKKHDSTIIGRGEMNENEFKYYDWLIFKSHREIWNFMEWKTFQFDFLFRLHHIAKRLKMKSTVITQDYRTASLHLHPVVFIEDGSRH